MRTSSTPDLRDRIAERAFEIYLLRGNEQGRELEHWLEAERDILASFNDSPSTHEIVAAADEIVGASKPARKKSSGKKAPRRKKTD